MARKNETGSSLPKGITFRESEGLFCIRIMRKGRKGTGYARTLEEAVKKLHEIEYQLDNSIYVKPNAVTVRAWFWEWLETYKKPHIRSTSLTRYRYVYFEQIDPVIGSMKMQKVRPATLQKLMNRIAEQGYSDGTISFSKAILNQIFEKAVINEIILKNPVEGVTIPKGVESVPHIALTEHQQSVFTEWLLKDQDELYYPFIMLMLYTGMRSGECAGLQWSDIDMKNGIIHVRHTAHREGGRNVLTAPKTRTSVRDIPIFPAAMEILKNLKELSLDQKVMGLVFFSINGLVVDARIVNHYLANMSGRIRKAGYTDFPTVTTHVMRHTFATRCIENGMPPHVLKTILGHSSLAMTMDLYAHVLPDEKRRYMDQVASAF